jgi:hypothetical protein
VNYGSGGCLAHMDKSELADWLATLSPGSNIDLRGTQLGTERLDRLLTAVRDEHGNTRLGNVRFSEAQFIGDTSFGGAQFSGDAEFSEAQFNGPAIFEMAEFARSARFFGTEFNGLAGFGGAQLSGDAEFSEAQFNGPAQFFRARFSGDAEFIETQFNGEAAFGGAQFSGNAHFDGAEFQLGAGFDTATFQDRGGFIGAQFNGLAVFAGAQFSGDAEFSETQFNGLAAFGGAQFSGNAHFDEAQFSGGDLFTGAQFSGDAEFSETQFALPVVLGPLLVRGTLSLAAASFEDTLVVEAVAAHVRLDRATCAAGGSLQLRYAEAVLDEARLAQPMTLAAAEPFTDPTAAGSALLDETTFAQLGWPSTPRLLSVRSTDVATLVVTDVSLAPCQFAGALYLDQLRLEGIIGFNQPPRGLRVGRAWPPVWWWTRRQTLAEEHAWRVTRPKGNGWNGPETQASARLEEITGQPSRVIGPERLSGLYRALRQAQESRKNEPGAADFYYGEMEMRRLASNTPWAERVILFCYWLVAGYGLRGLRALAALGVVVVALAGLFHTVGFLPAHPAPSLWDSLLYTASSTLSISDDTLKLTAWGKLLRILLRLLGPLLLGLALLSVRNRVKR